jgi:hypothetical protein
MVASDEYSQGLTGKRVEGRCEIYHVTGGDGIELFFSRMVFEKH